MPGAMQQCNSFVIDVCNYIFSDENSDNITAWFVGHLARAFLRRMYHNAASVCKPPVCVATINTILGQQSRPRPVPLHLTIEDMHRLQRVATRCNRTAFIDPTEFGGAVQSNRTGDTAISPVTSLNKSHSIGTTASTTDTTAATDPENTSPAAAAAAYRGGNVDWLSVLGQLLADAAARFPHLSEWHCVQRALRSVCLAIASNRSHSGDDDAKQQTNDYVRRQTVIISKTKSELFKTLSLSANNAAGHSDYEALQSFCASSPAAATRLKRIGQRAAAVAGEAAHPINIRAPANRSGDVVINLSDVVLTTLNASWVPADLRPQLAAVHRYLLADMEDQCLDGFRTNAVEKGAFLRQMMAFLIDNACTPKRIKAMMAVLIRYARDGQTLFKVEYNV